METRSNSIPKLPNDAIVEILTRLPVKSLLKFKCVCRLWLSLISSPEFVKTHLINSKKDSSFKRRMILLNCHGNLKQLSVHSLLYEPITYAFDTCYSVYYSTNLVRVVGSCDGLICLCIGVNDFILWNPSTGISKMLPDCGVKTTSFDNSAYGLGFGKSIDDYKVVCLYNGSSDLSGVIVEVYSLKCNKWKRIENFKGRVLMDDPAAFAHGKLYWIAHVELVGDIVSLDLDTEEYEILRKPDFVKTGYYLSLGAFEGCLYVLYTHLTSTDVWNIDIDYTVDKQTWNRVATVPRFFALHIRKKALYVLKNDRVLLLWGSTFFIFDAKNCSFTYPEIENLGKFNCITTYFESLVSPVG